MSGKTILNVSSLIMLPTMYVLFFGLRFLTKGNTFEQWLPKWDILVGIVTIIILERIYSYKYRVSQRRLLTRDIISNVVNLWLTGALAAAIVLPVLVFLPQHFLGHKFFFASSAQLGPVWSQVPVILVLASFYRYWVHRLQHEIGFLWELHSYHHRTSDLQASNGLVSNPIDYALRNVVGFLILGAVGFDPFAILIAIPVTTLSQFSHCGADIKTGILNYVFMTPEVHRWHHAAKTPEGHKYAVNYGVEFSFWDILFGTFYLPQKDGQAVQPERIGHPGGLADEGNYLRLLLVPLGLYRPLLRLKQALRIPGGHRGQQPAE